MTDDDEATREAPSDGALPTTELDPAATTGAAPLAYSAHTTSMPVVDYRPPRLRPVWIGALVLAAAIAMGAAMFVLGRTTAQQPEAAIPTPQVSTSTPAMVAPTSPQAAAPPVTVTVTQTEPPPPTTAAATSLPPLATPEARIAEPIICSLHNQYPQMQPVDLALTLLEQGIYRDYDEASLVVRLVLKDGCHGI
jgi:hypothetical protein